MVAGLWLSEAVRQVDLATANSYFASRLYSDAWDGATDANKTKALATAERQVRAIPLRADVPGAALTAAVCEQALWLLSSSAADRALEAKLARGLTGRTVGSASESYSGASGGRAVSIAPEAMAAIAEWVMRGRVGELRG